MFVRIRLAAVLVLACIGSGRSLAQTGQGAGVSASVAVVSDYRGRGLTISQNDAALQGSLDLGFSDGWSAGVWASTIAEAGGANTEVDLYAAKTLAVGPAEISVGGTFYLFPGGEGLDYGELQASSTQSIGPVDTTVAIAYAWDQDSIGGDSLYLVAEAVAPVGRIGPVSLGLAASLGYERGVLALEDDKVDWMTAITGDINGLEVSAAFIGSDVGDPSGDPGFVLSIGTAF